MIRDFVDAHRADMITTLQALLQIPSVEGTAEPGKPFGEGPADALRYVLEMAAEHGFLVKEIDGYAGHVEYGDGDEYVAVLSHLDVVPEGAGWTYPPFGAEIHDGKVYGRGAIDDKGPALSTLWALIALKSADIQPKRKIRLIFGLDEESGWQCMKRYFEQEPYPLAGFTPDADFPLIYAEKGIATLRLEMKAEVDSMCPQVIRFEGGQRVNMVPDYAYAVIDCHSETAAHEWEQRFYTQARQRQIELDVSVNGARIQLVVHGVSTHGSQPAQGVNAVVLLASLLSAGTVSNATMWRFVAGQDTAGKSLGIESEDEVTGALTSNLGRAILTDDTYAFLFNIRYPVDLTHEDLLTACKTHVSDKWTVTLEGDGNRPLYVPLDSPVVSSLLEVYRRETGDSTQPVAIGGGTYARAIPNGVAFGPLFPGQPELAHQKDECWDIDDYLRCIQIYAHAMLELANNL